MSFITYRAEHSNTPTAVVPLILCILLFGSGMAQNRSLVFGNGSWEQIKENSARDNKLVFLYAYANWCGICKKMNKYVFTNDSVADFFDQNFVNAKINMETGEGPALARQYKVDIYPTFLFADAEGKVVYRASGGMQSQELIELGRQAMIPVDPGTAQVEQSTENIHTQSSGDAEVAPASRVEIGLNVSQYQQDFGIGLRLISPYFLARSVAVKVGANLQWFEYFNGNETVLTPYQNFQLGMRGRSMPVTDQISVYGEGGIFILLPNSSFSSSALVTGGFGSFGFTFRISPRVAYYIELGGVGTGATADKVAGKPVYSNGFLTNVGLHLGF